MNYKKLRKKKKFTQSDVAIKVGISLMAYQLIERGVTKNPNPKTLKMLNTVLNSEVKI